jgi:hypothetical protein
MDRRALLALVPTVLAGCGGLELGSDAGEDPATEPTTARPTATDAAGRRTAGSTSQSVGGPPRAVRVANDTPNPAYVSVVVADGETTRFIESGEVPAGESRSFGDFAVEPGTYDVVVETAAGRRTTRTWRVADGGAETELAARVESDGIHLVERAYCELDCPPVSQGGTTTWDDRPRARGRVELRNEGGAARTVRMRLVADDDRLAEYEYAVPAGTTLVVPAYGRGSNYRVEVRRGGDWRAFDWGVGDGERLYVDLTATDARFRCGWRNRDLRVRNADDVPHRLDVAVTTDGETLFEETYELDAGAETLDPSVVENAGQYEFRIRSDRGAEASYVWNVCPPRGPVWVVVDDEGVQVSVSPA